MSAYLTFEGQCINTTSHAKNSRQSYARERNAITKKTDIIIF